MTIVSNPAPVSVPICEDSYLEILSQADCGNWVLSLPPGLRVHQQELEQLLGKVFAGRPHSQENLQLAKQMSLNWCFSKCRQTGVTMAQCYQQAV